MNHLQMARELGAEVVTTQDIDRVAAIQRIAREKNISQMVIGRSNKSFFKKNSLLDRLIRETRDIDIHVIKQDPCLERQRIFSFYAKWPVYFKTILYVLAVALLNRFLTPLLGYQAVGFVFLVAVIGLSLFVTLGPTLVAATLCATMWNFLFIPPVGTFRIAAPEDIMMFITYFIVSLATGVFTYRLTHYQRILRKREESTNTLYEILTAMTVAQGVEAVVKIALQRITELFNGACCVFTVQSETLTDIPSHGSMLLRDTDRSLAALSFENACSAGWSTEILPLSQSMAICLKLGERKQGVLLFRPETKRRLSPEQVNMLFVISNQIAVALAKNEFDEEVRKIQILQESEKLHNVLLRCISHDLRTPLTTILGASTALQEDRTADNQESRHALIKEIIDASDRLNHTLENLLDMTRLESGMMKLKMEWFDFSELIEDALERLKKPLTQHELLCLRPPNPIYVEGDYQFLEHAISNLILNAIQYSPRKSKIELRLIDQLDSLFFSIKDEGPGIPLDCREKIFDKFYRIPGSPTGGMGLGLAIAKSIIETHRGFISVGESEKGAEFIVKIPLKDIPQQVRSTPL
ncbi:MAG: DUF4118 domain-containing protein [Deltaproteobacteria bacterium]|nr:DUF4118 domain-containing protein [Deltaproteobacteria bacterium]